MAEQGLLIPDGWEELCPGSPGDHRCYGILLGPLCVVVSGCWGSWDCRCEVVDRALEATTADAAKAEALALVVAWCEGVLGAIRGTA